MEQINFKHLKLEKKKKVYHFQEVCAEIAELGKFPIGLAFALWKKKGNIIFQILAELKQGEIKKPEVYIKYLLKDESQKS